jgi:hypothetical protein
MGAMLTGSSERCLRRPSNALESSLVKQSFSNSASSTEKRMVSLDFPLVFGDALVFEFDSGFAHAAFMAVFGRRS